MTETASWSAFATYAVVAGVDIAKREASLAWLTPTACCERPFTIAQTEAGMQQLQQTLLALDPNPQHCLVVVEATSNHWMRLAAWLHAHHFAVWIINPAYVRFFARALGQQAKSDPIDATILAFFGISPQRKPPKLWSPPPSIHSTLLQLLNEREDMAALSTRTLNRLHALKERPDGLAAGYTRLRELQATTRQQMKAIEAEIQTALAQDPAWSTSVTCLRTIKGIGLLTAVWLTTLTVNFTAFQTPEELTSFIGLAPYVRQSGTTLNRNRATGQTGNPQMRKLLYLAAQNAKRFNPTIKAFYDRLLARGKKKQVATIAATRKLLHLAWALGTKQQRYDPAYITRKKLT